MTHDDRQYQTAFIHNEKIAADALRQQLLAEIQRQEVRDPHQQETTETDRLDDEDAEGQRLSDELACNRRLAASVATEAAAVTTSDNAIKVQQELQTAINLQRMDMEPLPGPERDRNGDSFMAPGPNETSNARAEDSSLALRANGDPATGNCSLLIP